MTRPRADLPDEPQVLLHLEDRALQPLVRRPRHATAPPPAPATRSGLRRRRSRSRSAAARSNSRLAAAARISLLERRDERVELGLRAELIALVRHLRHRHVVALVDARQHVVDVLDDRRGRDAVLGVVRLLHAPAAVGLVDRAAASSRSSRRRRGSRGRARCGPRGRSSESARPPSAGTLPCRRRESRPATPPAGRALRAAG